MTKKDALALSADDQARYDSMADWAEDAMPFAAGTATVRRGSEAAAHGRAALLEAGMDPAELDRLIGGRPSVDPDAKPGKHSPQINVRVSADMKQQIKALAAERDVRPSDMTREVLEAGLRELQRSHHGAARRVKHPA
ncbi:hypothetical protein AL755_03900 (plasmid) [Arthrobacter sp. ERGS1:01]|uniref:hypothetical protein n=1 Tax=Arthrobacter sp. ERGS1:01 TaxID=1704044 RepID=UPI0006B5D3B5|nr:hypothetical protein [Arthrobacter sp. ERGS1:01]ALE04830.1 hypothetical protein AL755_03900 [Arthrobacter sp. ERGS1:01]